MTHLILIRHSGLRQIDRAEVRRVLPADAQSFDRDEPEVDTRPLNEEALAGNWEGHDAPLREAALKIKAMADAATDPELHYFGLAQIPHIIALGSHLGDERRVHLHDYNRNNDTWSWPTTEKTLEVVAENVPGGPAVTSRGQAVIRVSISARVTDESIRPHVGAELLADITIRPTNTTPNLGIVRSEADVTAIREAIREAVGAIRAWRPGVHTIHVFAAAPVSVCFVIGQELKPRNSPPVQTYRFQMREDVPEYHPGILLRDGDMTAAERPLSDEQKKKANEDRRGVWTGVLNEVIGYARRLREDGHAGKRWYEPLQPRDALAIVAPFPTLRPLAAIQCDKHTIDPEPYHGEYGFDEDHQMWRLSDGLIVGFREAVGGNEAELRDAIRLFFFHEFCHEFHGLTKLTADEVGKFANCLEYIDYTADTFALLHQLDWMRAGQPGRVDTEDKRQRFLADQVDLILRSFWAFDPNPPVLEWQVRRLRRYMNWYWRSVQIRRSANLAQALRLFRRQPHVELAGLQQFARGRRVLVRLDRQDASTQLELAIVLEDERLFRVQENPNASLAGLLKAFINGDHTDIRTFFATVFEGAKQMGGHLPAENLPAQSV